MEEPLHKNILTILYIVFYYYYVRWVPKKPIVYEFLKERIVRNTKQENSLMLSALSITVQTEKEHVLTDTTLVGRGLTMCT